MKRSLFIALVFSVCFSRSSFSQVKPETFDTLMVEKIKEEGAKNSKVMETLGWLTDMYGPRLSGSAGYKRAAEWARATLDDWGLSNAHLEGWGPFGRGWELKKYSAMVLGRQSFPLNSYPKAWSPGTRGEMEGDILFFDAKTDSAVETYKGKLKNKFVLLGRPQTVTAHWKSEATRDNDSTLLALSNAEITRRGRRGFQPSPEEKAAALVEYKKIQLCQKEGAAALLTVSRGDGGTIFVQGATVPSHPDSSRNSRLQPYAATAPKILPQIAVGAEHYNRLVRMLNKGETPKLQMELDVEFTKVDSGYNVVAEIPGADLKDEVVMIGAHLDSWHGGTGATDNGTGSSVCLEAMRILKAVGAKPRRTIRIGLWCAEEQGLIGSAEYVKKHFATDSTGEMKYTSEGEKFCAYFNDDNGTGKFRGIYLQGNEALRPVFRAWLGPFKDMDASTISPLNTGGTDHQSFDRAGLPGFQFIQDPIEYFSRTWHSTMDVYERAQEDDLKQAAIIMAAFAYNAAMREERFPRKPLMPRLARVGGMQ